jgi:hypothetical protein
MFNMKTEREKKGSKTARLNVICYVVLFKMFEWICLILIRNIQTRAQDSLSSGHYGLYARKFALVAFIPLC